MGTDAVYVERDGQLVPAGVAFDDVEQLNRVARRIFSGVAYLTGEGSGLASGHLPDGSRVDAVLTSDVSPEGAQVVIRKQPASPPSLESLVDASMLPTAVADFLRASLLARRNVLIAGPARGGKTTLLAALADILPEEARLVVVERARELPVEQANVARLEAESQLDAAYSTASLLRRAPELLPDWVLVGDVIPEVAAPYAEMLARVGLCATLSLRNPGGPSDVRMGPRQALDRLVALAMLANPRLSNRIVEEQIATGLDLLVMMGAGEDADGLPVVSEVARIGRERDHWDIERLYRVEDGSDEAVKAATLELAAEASIFVGNRTTPSGRVAPLSQPVFSPDGSLSDMTLDEIYFVPGERAIGLREAEGAPVSGDLVDAEDEVWRLLQVADAGTLVWSDVRPEGIRLALARPPVSVSGAAVSVDRFDAQPGGLRRLADLGMVTEGAGTLLVKAARAGLSMLVCGPAGCGKQALVNSLLQFVEDDSDWQVLASLDRVTLPMWLGAAGEGKTMAGVDCNDSVDPLAALSAWSALWSTDGQPTPAQTLAAACDVLIRMGRVGGRQRMILSIEEVISQSDGYRFETLFAARHDASQRLTLVEEGQPTFQYRLDGV
jgi:Flp pilus assembly CpaF family ATPase